MHPCGLSRTTISKKSSFSADNEKESPIVTSELLGRFLFKSSSNLSSISQANVFPTLSAKYFVCQSPALAKKSKAIKLPDVICDKNDVEFHYETNTKANFITEIKVIGKLKTLTNKSIANKKIKLDDHIIFIENADPGYDFIFSYKIKGLVTKYGGANSHMAIRCAELNLPSLIGVGERNFNKMIGYKSLSLDWSRIS